MNWQPIPDFNHLEWAPSSEHNHVYVRRKDEPKTESIVEGKSELVQWVADNSSRPGHVAIGDFVYSITKKLGLHRCDACAKRQAKLNKLF